MKFNRHVRVKSGQLREHRLCSKCWRSSRGRHSAKGPRAEAAIEDTGQADESSNVSVSSDQSIAHRSVGTTEVRNEDRGYNNYAQNNRVKVQLSDDREIARE